MTLTVAGHTSVPDGRGNNFLQYPSSGVCAANDENSVALHVPICPGSLINSVCCSYSVLCDTVLMTRWLGEVIPDSSATPISRASTSS